MEPTINFAEIAALISCSKTSTISDIPEASGAGWDLYRGIHRLHTATYPFHVFSLASRATKDAVALVARKLKDMKQADVVFPPSLETRVSDIRTQLRDGRGAWTTKEYLASFIRDELGAYTDRLRGEAPKFYVNPFITTPAGVDRKIPNPLRSLLLDDSFALHDTPGALGILLAEPGQGKTYMCRHLVSEVVNSKRNLVPLMIDSSQWAAMPVADQTSLWKTIAHTFRHFGATIGWLDGNEDRFLRTTLKADLFRIIFDGFDEYVLRNQGAVQPLDVLDALSQLATETGARIVITSRTSFWQSNISEEDANAFLASSRALQFRIQPFDSNHATAYFEKRLEGGEVRAAQRIWSSVHSQSEELAGRGFVLNLVADVVERDETAGELTPGANSILWLVNSLCQRETLRQQLPYSGDQQVRALSALALETARGVRSDDDLVSLAFAETREELGIPGRQFLDKLKSHPLISFDVSAGSWEFREEQVRIALIADEIVHRQSAEARALVDRFRLEPPTRHDLGEMIVDVVAGAASPEAAIGTLQHLIQRLVPKSRAKSGVWSESHWLASTVALQAVDRCISQGEQRDRATGLIQLAGGGEVAGLAFVGPIARYDFRSVAFSHCHFHQVTWANCQFDESTIFQKCQFTGGAEPRYSRGFGSARFVDTILDQDASAWINAVRIKEGKRRYTATDLESDIQSVITKFMGRGGLGLRTVTARHLRTGTIASSKYRDEIVNALMGAILEEHHISGTADPGLNVRTEAEESVRFFTTNNVMTGPLRDAFDKLRRKLNLDGPEKR